MHRLNQQSIFSGLTSLIKRVTGFVLLLVATRVTAAAAPAQPVKLNLVPSFYAAAPRVKFENGVAVFWTVNSESSPERQIEVFNSEGSQLLTLNLIESLGGVQRIQIEDVSMGSTGMMAVSAQIFESAHRSKWSLILLGRSGQVISTIEVHKGPGILKVEVDDHENIWALGKGAEGADPALVPVLTRYDSDGNALGEYLRFSEFPQDAQVILEGSSVGGDVSMGVTSGTVWFWLPSSQQLVTVQDDGNGVKKLNTGVPAWVGPEAPQKLTYVHQPLWLGPGGLTAQVTFLAKSPNAQSVLSALYNWNQSTRQWIPISLPEPAAQARVLRGIDGGRMVFAFFKPDSPTVEVEAEPLTQ